MFQHKQLPAPSSGTWVSLSPLASQVTKYIKSHHFVDLGAAYGTAKSGIGIASMGVLKPDMIMKSIVPIIMAGILGIYGLIVAVILLQRSKLILPEDTPAFS